MKTPRFEKLVSFVPLAAVLIVTAIAGLAFRAERVLANSEFMVARTWEVITGLERAIGLVKDAETGARGYLITGDEHYVTARATAASLLPGELAHLEALVSDDPMQEQKMAEMAQVASSRMGMIASTVSVRRRQGQAAAFAVVARGDGLAEMERLRTLVVGLQESERGLLPRRQKALARIRIEARATVAFAGALDLVFIILAIGSLGYEHRLRHAASEASRRLARLQAINDVGLAQLSVSEFTDEMLVRLRSLAEMDAVALCGWHETEISITAVNGVSIAPGTRMPVQPNGPLAESGSGNRAVRLHGRQVSRLGIAAFEEQMRSILILPLSISSRVIGFIVAGRTAVDAFREEDNELLMVVADRITLAIDRASLYEGERAARRLAETYAAEVQLLNTGLEERVRQRTVELETTNSELEAFSYSVSHDLRAPLRSVDGFSFALEEDFGELLAGEGKYYLDRIRAGVQRMGQLIDALLQLSRITRSEMVVEPVLLSELALEVARELEEQNPARTLEFRIEPGLTARGDPRLLRDVFENMLGNAVKFTAGIEHARIEFGYDRAQDAYMIRDNGAGFDQQYAEKLFVAFQRLHGEKDFKGSGIGLATVGRVIRRHRGTMGAEGEVGKGATFWFTLGDI